MNTFWNLWTFPNIRCSFSLHRDQIIEQFLWRWTHSPIIDRWLTSNVFLFSSIWDHWWICLSINRFSNVWSLTDIRCPFCLHQNAINEEFRWRWKNPQYLTIARHQTPLFSSWRWDHWRISLIIITFAYVSSLTNIRFTFSHHRDEIIEEFFLRWTPSPLVHQWPRCDVPLLLIPMRWLKNFCHHHYIRQCFTIGTHPISFLPFLEI